VVTDVPTNGNGEHLDDLVLELCRTDEAEPQQLAHLRACQLCQERAAWLAQLERELTAVSAVEVPRGVEQEILSLAAQRARFARRLRGFRRTATWLVPLAAAAALVVAVVPLRLSPPEAPVAAAGPADVNGDGVVDIIDALVLAQAVEGRRETLPIWDLNHDQQIDNRDVEQIAMAAVRLQEEQR